MLGTDFAGDRSYDKWILLVRDAFSCMDRTDNYFSWKHLPGSGGFYNQDGFLFEVWETVRIIANNLNNNESFQEQRAVMQKVRDKTNGKN